MRSNWLASETVAFLREHRYPVSAEILEDALVCPIPIREYVGILSSNPDACLRLLGDVSRHLHARIREIERLTMQNARSRLIGYLLDQLVEPSSTEPAQVHLSLPRHVIASQLSMTPETLSRLLRHLADEGLLEIDDRDIVIKRVHDLRPYD